MNRQLALSVGAAVAATLVDTNAAPVWADVIGCRRPAEVVALVTRAGLHTGRCAALTESEVRKRMPAPMLLSHDGGVAWLSTPDRVINGTTECGINVVYASGDTEHEPPAKVDSLHHARRWEALRQLASDLHKVWRAPPGATLVGAGEPWRRRPGGRPLRHIYTWNVVEPGAENGRTVETEISRVTGGWALRVSLSPPIITLP